MAEDAGKPAKTPQKTSQKALEKVILSLAEAAPDKRLPPVVILASKLGRTPFAVRIALSELRKSGELTYSRGSAIMLSGASQAGQKIGEFSPAQRIFKKLTGKIRSGGLPGGAVLPPLSVMAREEHAGDQTVLAVYRRLLREGFVYRRGRQYVIGPPPASKNKVSLHGPVVLIVEHDEFVWRDLWAIVRTQDFCRRFTDAANAHGVQLVPVLAGMSGKKNRIRHGDAARKGLDGMIASYGKRYRGSLVVGQSWTYWNKELTREGLAQWLRLLSSYHQPVVWWDVLDEVGGKNSPEFLNAYTKMIRSIGRNKRFHRCYADQYQAAAAVVKALKDHGHNRALVAGGPYIDQQWYQQRKMYLERAARRVPGPTLELIFQPREIVFNDTDLDLMGPLGARGPEPGAGAFHPAYDSKYITSGDIFSSMLALARKTFTFVNRVKNPVALICMNDDIARLAGYWIREKRVRVPEQLSIVSFDADYSRLYPFTFSSLDLGFGELGHTAFHSLMGGTGAVSKGKTSIRSVCRLDHDRTIARIGSG